MNLKPCSPNASASSRRSFKPSIGSTSWQPPGPGLHEASIRNAVSGQVLCFVNGAFSQRWCECAVACDKLVVRIDVPWNTAVKPEQVEAALVAALASGPVDAITVAHNETLTGVTSPIRKSLPSCGG